MFPVVSDPEWEAYLAWREREIAAGRDEEPPPPWEIEGPAISISLGDAADVDPALLAAIAGPDGLGGPGGLGGLGGPVGAQFAQGRAADVLRPGPVLAALAEQAAGDLPALSDNELFGVLHAARRLENRLYYLQALAVAEFGRRRAAQRAGADARGIAPGRRPGERPDAELAAEALISRNAAGDWLATAAGLASRLPRTLAGMAAGLIDPRRAGIIACYTARLSREDAAAADEALAAVAPQVRAETLAARAAALEMRLDPQAAAARREHARQARQRVEVRREEPGNAAVAGRELALGDALASKASIHALALALRRGGAPGTLDALRVTVFNDLLQGRDPLDRLAGLPRRPATASDGQPGDGQPGGARAPGGNGQPGGGHEPGGGQNPEGAQPPEAPLEDPGGRDEPPPAGQGAGHGSRWDIDYQDPGEEDQADGGTAGGPDPDPDPGPGAGAGAGGFMPVPAVINLIVRAGTLLGWDTTPSEAGGWGLLDPEDTRAIVRAASLHPQTRWCMTVTGDDGTATAHGCAPGQHPWNPADPSGPAGSSGPGPPRPGGQGAGRQGAGPPGPSQLADLAGLIRRLSPALAPVATGGCDHASAEDRHDPGRALRHLIQARTATCTGPGCRARAVHADLDHTIPWPDGPTCQCNLGPKCRAHHRCKETPGWKLEQPQPGIFRWTLPNGRVHLTRPTSYD